MDSPPERDGLAVYVRYFELYQKRGWCRLCELANDDTLPSRVYTKTRPVYSEYLKWNKDWVINKRNSFKSWCHHCERLNADQSEAQQLKNSINKIYPDIAKWY